MIELMVVVAIIAILAVTAISAYDWAMRKSRRGAAQGCLSERAQYMERFYATNLRYDQTPAGVAVAPPACSTDVTNFYTIDWGVAVTTTSYQARAVAINNQVKDTACATMTVNQKGVKTPAANCW